MNCERFEKGDFACVIKTVFQDHIAPMRLNIRKIHFNFFFFFFLVVLRKVLSQDFYLM